jgi:transcriptional regulator with XRE-family HTH domain
MTESAITQFNEDQLKKFGMRLRQIRKEKKMSQLDLELDSGVYISEISKIENGMQNIEFLTLSKLALALKVEMQELFRFDLSSSDPSE